MNLCNYNPRWACCFHLRDLNRPLKKCKQTLVAKKLFFPKIRLKYKNFDWRSVMLSLGTEIIRKCMSIDASFSLTTGNGFTCKLMSLLAWGCAIPIVFHNHVDELKFLEKDVNFWAVFTTIQRASLLRQDAGIDHTQIGQFVTRDLEINYA